MKKRVKGRIKTGSKGHSCRYVGAFPYVLEQNIWGDQVPYMPRNILLCGTEAGQWPRYIFRGGFSRSL